MDEKFDDLIGAVVAISDSMNPRDSDNVCIGDRLANIEWHLSRIADVLEQLVKSKA